MDIVEIDGTFGEGGGQIVRTSLTMSALTRKPFHIFNVRKERKPKPHLQPQHLQAARSVREVTNGTLINAELGSHEFTFYPGEITPGKYEFNVGTAGSVILVAQTIIPILISAREKSVVRIIGGTTLPKSPGYDYFEQVFLKAINYLGAKVECRLIRSGYYPKGNGEIELNIYPAILRGCQKWPAKNKVKSIIRIANLPMHIAEREKQTLKMNNINDVEIYTEQTLSSGNIITLWHDFCGTIEMGKRGRLAELVAQLAVKNLKIETADVDQHLADQLLIYAMLARGKTIYKTSKLTQHLITNHHIISLFLKREVAFDKSRTTVNIP